jgi:hypothetical protein
MADCNTGTAIGGTAGEIVGEYTDYDGLIAGLRERAAAVGLAYLVIDDLAGLSQGHTSALLGATRKRHFSINSLLSVARVLGIKSIMVVDPEVTSRVRAEWGSRDGTRAHARRRPALGEATMRRVLKPVAAELGRRGHVAQMKSTTPEQRREFGRRGAMVRWQKAATMTVRPIGDPASPLRVWIDDELPTGAPE